MENIGKHLLPDKGYNGYKSRSYFISQRTPVGVEKLVCVCKLVDGTQECIFRTASVDDNALITKHYFGLMPINMYLPTFILMQMCFESQFCQSCPDVPVLQCQLLCSTVFADNLLQLNVFVHSPACNSFSHFVSRKGVSSASPFLNCAFPALLRNACLSSLFNLDSNALQKLLLYLLQICLCVFHMKFLSSFPCQSAPNPFFFL